MDLNLIFASLPKSGKISEIESLVERSGYGLCRSDLSTHLKNNSSGNKVLVVNLESSSDDLSKLNSLLKLKSPYIPCFYIFHCSSQELNLDLVDKCCDFVVWPCAQSEFFYRLHSLATSMKRKLSLQTTEVKNTMIGESYKFKKVLNRIELFAGCDAPVLIEGETGTGKEMIARAIHYQSGRQGHPFIPVNCGALPDNLIENELFGHQKGAYTDAKSASKGLVGQAEGGTLFLDEMESLSLKGQVVLLRLIQEQEYKPLGKNSSIKSNVRIVSATNVCLKNLVSEGVFRQDLFYRLNILNVRLPLLIERDCDILLLADFFLRKFKRKYNCSDKKLTQDALDWIESYSWPGNIRELENYIHRAFLLSEGKYIDVNHLYDSETESNNVEEVFTGSKEFSTEVSFNDAKSNVIEAFEKSYLRKLMQKFEGNVTLAAKKARKERRAFGKLLKKHGIKRNAFLV